MPQISEFFCANGYFHILQAVCLVNFMNIITTQNSNLQNLQPEFLIEIDKFQAFKIPDASLNTRANQIFNIIKELKTKIHSPLAQHIKYLKISNSDKPTIQTTSVLDRDYVIEVSYGMINKDFNIQEIRAVIAHEIGHILHHDVNEIFVFNYYLAQLTPALILASLAYICNQLPAIFKGKSVESIESITGLLIVASLIYKNNNLSQFFIQKEFQADKKSIEMVGDPQALISAIKKLEKYQAEYILIENSRFFQIPPQKNLTDDRHNFVMFQQDPYSMEREFVKTFVKLQLKICELAKGWLLVASHPYSDERYQQIMRY